MSETQGFTNTPAVPGHGGGNDESAEIAELRAEIARLQGNSTVSSAPAPVAVETVSPDEVDETPEEVPNDVAARPLLAGNVDDKGNPTYPVNYDGTPDMNQPGVHQSPVSHVHLDNGDVVKIIGAIPGYIHDAETGLHRVIAAYPVLDEMGRTLVAGLVKSL